MIATTSLWLALVAGAPPRLVTGLDAISRVGVLPQPTVVGDADANTQAVNPVSSSPIVDVEVVPSLEGRVERRRHTLTLRFDPRILVRRQEPALESEIEPVQALIEYRGSLVHRVIVSRLFQITTRVSASAGQTDFRQENVSPTALGELQDSFEVGGSPARRDAGRTLPPVPRFFQTRVGGEVSLSLRSSRRDDASLTFLGGQTNQWTDLEVEGEAATAALTQPFFDLGFQANYSRGFTARFAGTFTGSYRHVQFYEEDRSNVVVTTELGLSWTQSPRLVWTASGGVQVFLGERQVEDPAEPLSAQERRIDDVLPSGQLALQWRFLTLAETQADLTLRATYSGFIDQFIGVYVPLVAGELGLSITQAWGRFDIFGLLGTPPVDLPDELVSDQGAQFLTTSFASLTGRLDLPVSEFVGVFTSGRVATRGASFSIDGFPVDFFEMSVEIGFRAAWSSGRDERLPRPRKPPR